MSTRRFAPWAILAGALVVEISLGPAACAGRGAHPSTSSSGIAASAPSAPGRPLLQPVFAYADTGKGTASIADVAARAAPGVVNVASSRTVKDVRGRLPFLFDDPLFRRFFGPGEDVPAPQEKRLERGLGSGVIISADGIVLTNNHVVEGADEIKVTAADKREFRGKVLGTDAKSDLAVLRLEGDVHGLTPLEFADPSRLRVGDVVLAIGNPFGVGQTITMGIVSAKGRANVGIAAYEDFIQTDAAINPGNSGGALVDMEGKLVGVNTAILSRSGGNMGIGFAIPANMAQPIMKALIEHGKVVRGWLGVTIQDIDQDLASAMKLPAVKGILVSEVTADGPAAKAGLRSGDVVLALNGQPVDSTGEFRNAVAAAGAGATVKLELSRDGKPVNVDAKLGELPEKLAGSSSVEGERGDVLEGLTLEDLDQLARQKFDIPPSVKSGVVVTEVDPGGAGAASGLRAGDVIVEAAHLSVTSVSELRKTIAARKGPVLLRILREGRPLFLVLKR